MAVRRLVSLNKSTPQLISPQTSAGDTVDCPVTLNAATGNEIAYDLQFTTNKATSGNDTGLLINQTDTASPGTSKILELQVGGVTKVFWQKETVTGNGYFQFFPPYSFLGTSTDDKYIRLEGAGNWTIKSAGPSTLLQVNKFGSGGDVVITPALDNSTSGTRYGAQILPTYNQASGTAANTDLLINRTETAIGSGAQNLIDLQVGGTSKVLIDNTGTYEADKTTADEGFINFKATADADATSAISTLATSGATTGHVQVEINGTKAWIAVSTNNPT